MFHIHFDPITSELVLKKKKIASVTYVGDDSSATVSALSVSTDLGLIVNNLTVNNYLEVQENGAFNIYDESSVEVR